jgi:hypothetical protein
MDAGKVFDKLMIGTKRGLPHPLVRARLSSSLGAKGDYSAIRVSTKTSK